MPIRNLDQVFQPRRVAVIGASVKPSSVGHVVLRNLIGAGYRGVVYPVNPKYESVLGIHAYANVRETPHPADLAVICTPAATVPDLVRECGEVGIHGVVVISAGFREAGEEGRKLEDQVLAAAAEFDGMRIVGPNCLGVIAPALHFNASFAAATPEAGSVAFISQSGALCTSVLDWALEDRIGFSNFCSIGNMLDVGVDDLIDYFAADARTQSIILYIESITEARPFMSAARAFTKSKPIVVYKAGRFAESAQAAASHTGALAGVDAVYEAAFERAGMVRVYESEDMFDAAELLARKRTPRGPNLAIITNAGGPGVMATDELIARDGRLAKLKQETLAKLDDALPAYWSHGNPVDVLGDAPPERYAEALEIALADDGVDAALVILTPQAMTDPSGTAEKVAHVAARTHKPILAAWMGKRDVGPGADLLNAAGVPTYATPERGVRAFMYLVQHQRRFDILYETPKDLPVEFSLERERMRQILADEQGRTVLSEVASKALLDSYGIPTTRPTPAADPDAAVSAAEEIGFPIVMKVDSPEITHKTDVGGVELGISNGEEVRAAFERITRSAGEHRPEAEIRGVTVQRMVSAVNAYELIVGSKTDPVFGAVVMVGLGGTEAEVHRDTALGLPPLNERLARRMIESLRAWKLLQGWRGKPPVDVDQLVEVLMRISYLVADAPEIKELDINPLLVSPKQVVALDARVILHEEPVDKPGKYPHLAIRPYPHEYVRETQLKDGSPVTLRPIKPEDEPLWHELLANSSQQSIWFRFRYLFKESTHEMAARFCYIDYDRELAIVAEVEDNVGNRRLIGVGRLAADPDHEEAEYAVLVVDDYQNRGLGSLLTDYCLDICVDWGIRHVVCETSPDNPRMLEIFRKRGFKLQQPAESDVVLGNWWAP